MEYLHSLFKGYVISLPLCFSLFACSNQPSSSPHPNSNTEGSSEGPLSTEESYENLDQECYQQCKDKGEPESICLTFCIDDDKEGKESEEGEDEEFFVNPLPALDLDVDGEMRQYRLFVPDSTEANLPLILFLHGGGGRDLPFPQQALFQKLAQEQGIILAFGLSKQRSGEEGEWLLNTTPDRQHDLRYIQTLIDTIHSNYTLDLSRVYAVGYSLGAMYTYDVMCHLSDRFTAVASHAGSMPIQPASCNPTRHVPFMHIHDISDSIIPYDQSWNWKEWDSVGPMYSVPDLLQYWSTRYQCQTQNEIPSVGRAHLIYSECDQGVRIEHHRLVDVGHGWPLDIDTQSTPEVIWSFLNDFRH